VNNPFFLVAYGHFLIVVLA